MRKELATLAALVVALGAGASQAQSDANRARLAFEVPGEAVQPAEMQKIPDGARAPAGYYYYYRQCFNYYRWYYTYYYGWQRYFVGTRCY